MLSGLKDAFGVGDTQARTSDFKRQYEAPRSLIDMLPWVEYLPESQQFLFADARSRMAGFEIEPIPTEGRGQDALEKSAGDLAQLISDSLPEKHTDPWVIQICQSEDADFRGELTNLESYVKPDARGSAYTEDYLRRVSKHVDEIASPGGYFHDDATDAPWRASRSSVRVIIYRRYWRLAPRDNPEIELMEAVEKITANLDGAGLRWRHLTGERFYNWMVQWFNPAPEQFAGDSSKLLEAMPWPGDEDAPVGRDLAAMLFADVPRCDSKSGYWYFNNQPHAVVSVGALRRAPLIGQLTGEIDRGKVYALTDRLPAGTRVMMTITLLSQDEVANRITVIDERAMGDTAESRLARRESRLVLEKQALGDKLYPTEIALFVRGGDEREIRRNVNVVVSLVNQQGVSAIDPASDPIRLDSYLKNLPGVYIPELDRVARRRSRVTFASHCAALAPVYGRSRGTGHPGMLFWNRSAEPLTVDPLNPADRKKNAHMLVIGPTGAGKSATLVSILDAMVAVHRPRIYIVEAGGSFDLFGDYLQTLGVSVHKVRLSMDSDVAVPPFADLYKLADERDQVRLAGDGDISDEAARELDEFDDEDAQRDRLGEAEIIVRMMITGGEAAEEARMRRADRSIIRRAIMLAATRAAERPAGESRVVMPEEISACLREISQLDEYRDSAKNIREMADAMLMFCSGLNGHLFNREGEPWPEADVTIVDMAQAAQEGFADTLAVAYTSLMQTINAVVEREQRSARNTIVLTDEGHIITTNPLLSPYIIKITKMWRKLGAWFWLATQNIQDFPDDAQRLLNMMEWWLALTMPPDEIAQTARFKTLTDEQAHMMLQCRKEPGKFVEGVILSDMVQTLFRNVPPPLSLALAQTEKHEKANRQKIMDEFGLDSEVQAAWHVASQMVEKRRAERAENGHA